MSKTTFADVMSAPSNGRRKSMEQLCFSPDLAEEYQALMLEFIELNAQEAKQAARAADSESSTPSRRLNDKPKSHEVLKKMAALVEDNPTAFYEVVFEQSTRSDWLALRAQHAPRDDVDEDEGRYNHDTFPLAALQTALVDPEPTDDVVKYFEANLSSGEWDRIGLTVWNLNEGVRDVPKVEPILSLLAGGETL